MDFGGPRAQRVCPDCSGTSFVEDHAAGDILCRNCGLVVEAHIIDERSEWRTFGDKEKEGDDPSRVGAAANDFFADGGLSTMIGKVQGDGGSSYMLNRLQQRQNTSERTLQTAVREIQKICDKLSLVQGVKDAASRIFKDVNDARAIKGRSQDAVYAACIFVACKQQNMPRTFKEIGAAIPNANKKDIGRCFNAIDRMYKNKKVARAEERGEELATGDGSGRGDGPQVTKAVQLLQRFTSSLGFERRVTLGTIRIGERASELGDAESTPWSGRNPSTLASAIIHAVCLLQQIKDPTVEVPSLEEIAGVTGMAPSTMKELFLKMLPYFVKPGCLVDVQMATPEQLQELEQLVQHEEAMKHDKAKGRKAKAK